MGKGEKSGGRDVRTSLLDQSNAVIVYASLNIVHEGGRARIISIGKGIK